MRKPFILWGAASVSVFLLAGCKDCPPCREAKADKTAAQAADAGLEETDAGIKGAAIGGKPHEVKEFKLYARAGFDKVNIWEKPDMASPRLGYFRRGAYARVGDPRFSSETCPEGWFQLEEGGYVCQGRGMLIGEKPRAVPNPPHPPRIHELDPYKHGFVRRDWTPAYKKLPLREEMWQPPTYDAEETADGGVAPGAGQIRPPCPTEAELARMEAEKASKPAEPAAELAEPEVPCSDYAVYTRRKYRNVRQLLSRGFWASVTERLRHDETGETYYRTVQGDFVPADALHLVRPPEFQGYAVTGEQPLPAAIVTSRYAAAYELQNGKFRSVGPVDRLSAYHVREERQAAGGTYYQVESERWLKAEHVAYFPLRTELPEGVKPDEKWIHVDLTHQTLEAYDGLTPVYVTLVSTGLPNTKEGDTEIVTETPHGRFRISFKHVTDDMTGTVGDNAEVYSVADVPWVQYIFQNVALHGAFWHSKFGAPKSHGCINLSPADARYLFDWSDPPLPKGWHGVAAVTGGPSTLVIIDGKTPK
jgi:lipoprotein-anchoring transpeptidase ErfK/SrfK